MTIDPSTPVIALFAGGLQLLLAGAGVALFAPPGRWARTAVLAGCAAIAVAVTAVLMPGAAVPAGAAVCGIGLADWAVGSAWAARWAAALVRLLRQARVRWAALGVCGGGLLAAGAGSIGDAVSAPGLGTTVRDEMNAMPPLWLEGAVYTTTDRGAAVRLDSALTIRPSDQLRPVEERILGTLRWHDRLIRRGPAGDHTNCFGWVFTGGQYWLEHDQVETILKDNGYRVVATAWPGDLVVYRDGETISHAAIVRAVCDDGAVLVEGKWGWMGVFMHPVDDSCYGENYTLYRSDRPGHVLAGLTSPEGPGDDVLIDVCE
jgi:hypothetical protein